MKLKAYAVYDSKVEAFLQPFFMRADGEAIRACQEACRDPNGNFARHAGDYTLFGIGEFNDDKGILIPYDTLQNLGNFLQIHSQKVEVSNG